MTENEMIYEWLKTCPELYNLWAVSTLLQDGTTSLQPNSSANMYDVRVVPMTDGGKRIDYIPVEPYYFDMDIVAYRAFYAHENEVNIDVQEELQKVCDWLIAEQNNGRTPYEECYQIECLTSRPFMRGAYYNDGDVNTTLTDYVITVRFYVPNPGEEKHIYR